MSIKAHSSLSDETPSVIWKKYKPDEAHKGASDQLLLKAQEMLRVKTGKIADIRDGRKLSKPQYQFPMLSVMLRQSLINNGKLRVMDIGGMLGSSYFQFLRYSKKCANLIWCIVELPSTVEAGKRILEDETLRFCYSIESCVEEIGGIPDVVLLSGVLQYVESWQEMLTEVRDLGSQVIMIDRMTVADKTTHQICLQTIEKANGGTAVYPIHFISENELFAILSDKYDLLTNFESSVDRPFLVEELLIGYKGSIWHLQG